MASGVWDLIILDEINNALHLGLVDLEQVLEIIQGEPSPAPLCAHGSGSDLRVVELANTVSEVQEIKHAFRVGIEPQPSVDY